jgi:predicted Zn finger-like uncharacterized protein
MSTENDLVAKCPQCGSMFRLTPQHLQAAKGWVQCGMCGNVFHSGLKLAAEEPAAPAAETPANKDIPAQKAEAPAAEPQQPAAGKAPATPTSPETPADAGAEAAAVGLSGLAQRMADEHEVPSAFGPKLESIILVDPNLPHADDDYGPMPVFEAKPEPPKPESQADEYKPATPPTAGWGARQSTATSTGWIPRRPAPAPTARPGGKKTKLGWLWALLIIFLLLALAAQLVYSMRDRLAASYPELRPLLETVCEDLNCTISLPRDPQQVVILGSDLQTENNDSLSLEVTLANRASYPMAWPVLELTLTDVEDQPLARRMFAPSEYLPSSRMEAAGIQGRSEVPVKLQLQNKGLKAAGYRLRMFY